MKNKFLYASLSSIIFTSFSAPVIAQEQDEAKKSTMFEEVIVTASRREQALQNVPSSMTAINPLDFTVVGLTTIGDIIEYTPGFSIDRSTGIRGGGSIAARGVGQQGATAVVSVYVDDVPMTSNSGFSKGQQIFFDGLMGDIERVELIKGPQGTLFGATAIGGAIRYISKKPALSEVRGSASVNISDMKDGGFSQIYNGFVSLPVVEDKLGVTLSGFLDNGGGMVDRVDPATGETTLKDADTSKSYGFSADVLLQASDNLDFRVKGMYQNISFNGTSVVALGPNNESKWGYLRGEDQFSTQNNENKVLSATLDYDFDFATLTATSSYSKYAVGLTIDITGAFAGLGDLFRGAPPGTTTEVSFTAPTTSEKYVQEVRLTSQESETFEWIIGLYYADESTKQDQLMLAQPDDFNLLEVSFPSGYKEYAAFGNLTYYITPKFDVTVGMRYADTAMELRSKRDGALLAPPRDVTLPTSKANIQTYLFTTRYRPNDDMSLYARVASGYRPTSAALSIPTDVVGVFTPETLFQDTVWSYEVGAKGNLSDGLFAYDLSLYYLDWGNFQTLVRYNGLTTSANAASGITAKGFEGTFTLKPADGFTIISTIAYSDSTLNEDEPGLNGLKGASVPTVPKWTASTRANYDFDISDDITGNFGGGFRYVQGASSRFTLDPVDDILSDSFVIADLSARASMDNVSLNLYVTNLFNKAAFSAIGVQFNTGTPVRPRTIGAVLSVDF